MAMLLGTHFQSNSSCYPEFLEKMSLKQYEKKLEGYKKEMEEKEGELKGIFPVQSEKQEGESTAHSIHSTNYEHAKNFINL